MEKRVNLLIVLLILMLGLNLYLMLEIRNVKHQVQFSRCSSDTGWISHQINTLTEKIDEFQDSKWVISKTFLPNREASSPEAIHLDLELSFREIEKGANVYLVYRDIGSANWTNVPTDYLKGSHYLASLILSPEYEYEYQIIAEGTSIITSDISKIPARYYRREPLELITFEVSETGNEIILGYQKILYDFYRPQKAVAKLFKYNELISTIELEFENVNEQTFTQIQTIPEATRILLEYKFEDGLTYLAEIFPEITDDGPEGYSYRENFEH